MSKMAKKALAIVLACSMAFAFTPVAGVSNAKAKKPTLRWKTVTAVVGDSASNSVKANGTVVKSVSWNVTNKKVASAKKTAKLSADFTGKKAGTTKATAKVKYKKSKKSKKTLKVTLKFSVKVEALDEPGVGDWVNNTTHSAEGIYDIEDADAIGIYNAIQTENPDIEFNPLAMVAYQVVEGLNCRIIGSYRNTKENSVPVYAIFSLYRTPAGAWSLNAEGFLKSNVPVCSTLERQIGSWSACLGEDMNITEGVAADVNEATSKESGFVFEPSAVLAMQEGVGFNRVIVGCDYTVVDEQYYIIFTSFSNDDGNSLGADYNGTKKIEKFELYSYNGSKIEVE